MNMPSKFVNPLDNVQLEILNDIMNDNSSARVRKRAHAILLSSKGYGLDEISDIVEFHRDSISSWIDAWEEQGVQGLFEKPRSGAPPKLTESEVELVKKLIKETPASPKTVLAKIFEQTGKIISRSTLRRIAKAAGLCWKRARKSLKGKRDEVVILDNAPVHHSYNFESNIPEWEKKGLILKYIPAYSPELNLIEILWRFIKYYRMPFTAYLSFENLVQAVENILRGIGTEYNISFA